ncbi:zonadhesin [Biomphalaria pfeifferi]|uniref:Zonadhesin n=1 Tax=Biomphalaria pfeifferi TaxID=112525 RepID=A0AAD8BBY6_BIOPF|nr:zonadhesin [Biomphalaria pfeifferi]
MTFLILFCLGFCCFSFAASDTYGTADIIFVIDSSDRVALAKFHQIKSFVRALVSHWNVSLTDFRIGVISYGNGVHVESKLINSVNLAQVDSAISSITHYNAPGDATEALKLATQEGFLPANGGRPGTRQIIVHVGAGPGLDPSSHASQVKIAIERGLIVYNVAVGDGWTQSILSQYADIPPSRYSLPVAYFFLLDDALASLLAQRIINEAPKTVNELPQVTLNCLSRADIVICLDGSTSVTSNNFVTAKENLKTLVSHLPVGQNGVHVGFVQFSGKTSLEFPLTILQAIDKIQYMHGTTETGQALSYIRNQVFTNAMGARLDVPRIILLLTDGAATHHSAAINEALLTRQNGITIITVGIGSQINQKELEDIADDTKFVYKASSFNDLTHLITPILNATCQAPVSTPPPATTQDPELETCFDKITTCDLYIQHNTDHGGFCATYVDMAKQSCAKSCAYCSTVIPAVTSTPPPCVDRLSNCSSYSTADCVAFSSFFSERCAQMCGLCDVKADTPGFHGKCMYKSKIYEQGDKWIDGCDYECTCVDAAHGRYECSSICDVYHNLPPFCTLVKKEGECCLQPVCHFESTLHTFTEVSPGVTPDNMNVCQYLGGQYQQNEFIDDGCNNKCFCVNAFTGLVNCTATCPEYNTTNFPSNCYLESVPGSCCKIPKCELLTTTATISGFGTVSDIAGYKVIYDESKQPACTDLKPECPLYGKDACEGSFKPFMKENCPVFCNLCNEKYPGFVAGPNDWCTYNGVHYKAGDTWEPDCEHQCVCDTQYYGYYRCYSKCTTYSQIPDGCKLEKLAGDCCPRIICPGSTSIVPSTTNLLSHIVAGSNIYVITSTGQQKPLLPTLNMDGTVNYITSGYQTYTIVGCLFNGRLLVQGEFAKDSNCGPTCQCLNQSTGLMSCVDRCPYYVPENKLCTIVTDPFDACCKVPSCPLSVTNPPSSIYLEPKVKEIYKCEIHLNLVFSSLSFINFIKINLIINYFMLGRCHYGGQSYREGDRWTVGCDLNCLCVNAMTNLYVCDHMCLTFNCPQGYNCTAYPDPEFPCCNLVLVNLPTNTGNNCFGFKPYSSDHR